MKPGPAIYWHTVRHLRPVQIYGRIRFRLIRPHPDLSPAPLLRAAGSAAWTPPARLEPSLIGPERIRLLNVTRDLAACGWDDPRTDLLWRYHLHYFEDLNARDAASRREWHRNLLPRWVRENPPGVGTGWDSYPTSRRVVNWIKWALAGHELPAECVRSLAVQARWLQGRVEYHLLGNHLFANAKALIFAGLYFDGREAQAWLQNGMAILEREIPEQILPDGGQFERSTMYHALALEDMLDLYNVTTARQASPSSERFPETIRLPEQIAAMRTWLAAMCHPDGEIGLFNDAAIGIAPSPAELEAYAQRLGFVPLGPARPESIHLQESGYIRVACGEMVALLDVAPIGPDYLPGHAHADTLSFELSLRDQRVLVNSGTSTYVAGAERQRQRGTAAHNTVVVDGRDSSEVWASFRVGRRARAFGVELSLGDRVTAQGAHDGYRRLPGRPVHTRRWSFSETSLVVEDRVSGSFHRAEARFHLHPDVRLERAPGAAAGRLVLPDGRKLDWCSEEGELSVEESTYSPQFGVSLPACCLVNRCAGGSSRVSLRWA